MTSAVLALCVSFSAPVAVQAEFLDGLEQEILASPSPRLAGREHAIQIPAAVREVPDAALAGFDAAFFRDMHEAETAALIARSLAGAGHADIALTPETFLDPREAETAALIARSLAAEATTVAALSPELFLDPYGAGTAALIVAALAEPHVEATGSLASPAAAQTRWIELNDESWEAIVLP
jgi:hypothetical protein